MCYFQHKRSDSLGFKRMANRKTNLAPSTLKLKTKIGFFGFCKQSIQYETLKDAPLRII